MSNATWACFDCRETVRRPHYAAVHCPTCARPCRCVGDRLRLPPKHHAKAWQDLLVGLQQQARFKAERDRQTLLQRRRDLQREIDRLEALGPNEGRARQVRLLRRRLEQL